MVLPQWPIKALNPRFCKRGALSHNSTNESADCNWRNTANLEAVLIKDLPRQLVVLCFATKIRS
jgi:hypothetical protein